MSYCALARRAPLSSIKRFFYFPLTLDASAPEGGLLRVLQVLAVGVVGWPVPVVVVAPSVHVVLVAEKRRPHRTLSLNFNPKQQSENTNQIMEHPCCA